MTQPVQTKEFARDSGSGAQNESQCPVLPKDIEQLQLEILPLERAQQMAEFFGTLADSTRLRLLSVLAIQEQCVCDLATLLRMSESAVSHQLRVLRTKHLVKYRKQGRNVYYSLADSHVTNLYREVDDHLTETD